MLHIRLSRTGKRKQPLYRLIVTEKSQDPWGTFLVNLGTYNPRSVPPAIAFKADRIKDWISKGAQCSETVWNLLVDQKIVAGEKVKKVRLSMKRHEKMDKASADAKAKDEAKKAAEAAPAPEAPKEEPAPAEAPAAEAPKEAPASAGQEPAA